MKQNHKDSLFKPHGEQIHDLSMPLGIDELLLSLLHRKGKNGVRSELKMNRKKILTFGRQMLSVAISQGKAGLEEKDLRGNIWRDWARKGHEVEKALDEFLSFFGTTRFHIGFVINSLRSYPGGISATFAKKPPAFRKVMKEASNLLKAKGTIHWLARDLEKKSHFIKPRQNPGSPEKREFAMVAMEAWAFLTGKVASPSNTPFNEFLSAAWADSTSTEEVEDWEHHIRIASSTVKFQREVLHNVVPPWMLWKSG